PDHSAVKSAEFNDSAFSISGRTTLRRESQAVFQCVACDHRQHADVNAAQNLLRRSTALMRMEDLHQQCYEVRTEARLAPLANPPGFNRGKMLTKWLLA